MKKGYPSVSGSGIKYAVIGRRKQNKLARGLDKDLKKCYRFQGKGGDDLRNWVSALLLFRFVSAIKGMSNQG